MPLSNEYQQAHRRGLAISICVYKKALTGYPRLPARLEIASDVVQPLEPCIRAANAVLNQRSDIVQHRCDRTNVGSRVQSCGIDFCTRRNGYLMGGQKRATFW